MNKRLAQGREAPIDSARMSSLSHKPTAYLLLEDGRRFDGQAVGHSGSALGEVVFNTCMSGYQEVLTDPSYSGQLVTMTSPHIGNCGVNSEDAESSGPKVAGFVMREVSEVYSSWRANGSLQTYLAEAGIPAISGVDTRALTRHLRSHGAMRGAILPVGTSEAQALETIRAQPSMEGSDLVSGVSTTVTYTVPAHGEERFHVVAFDMGVKANSPKLLAERGCRVTVVPFDTSVVEIRALQPHGLFVSNGPGDPAAVPAVADVIRALADENLPVFGICLGLQLVCRAFGGTTFKLPFGHHGGNHPVKNLETGKVEITSQNHGFAVRPGSDGCIEGAPHLSVTHLNLYDGTVEGVRHGSLPVFAVQYHPEAAPGPHDSRYLFDQFLEALATASR